MTGWNLVQSRTSEPPHPDWPAGSPQFENTIRGAVGSGGPRHSEPHANVSSRKVSAIRPEAAGVHDCGL
jgi:hypothetical protein